MNHKKTCIKALVIGLVIGGSLGCKRELVFDSTPEQTVLPFAAEIYATPSYILGVGNGDVFTSIPDTIAIVVDSLAGFEGGFGGITGQDSLYLLKSDITGWPDTTAAGGYSVSFEKFNKGNRFKVVVSTNVVLAAPIESPLFPGPTALDGDYKRTANAYIISVIKVFEGVYVIDNPGGAGVAPQPYLLYDFRDRNGKDSLSFAAQTDGCGGGLKLVAPGAPDGLTIAQYDESFPPVVKSLSPVTLEWKVFEFEDTSPGTAHPGFALCAWGLAVRTFEKQ